MPYVCLIITVRIGSDIMWKRICLMLLVILLGFTIAGFLFIPKELDIPTGKKVVFVAFSKSYLEFDEENVKPAIDSEIYELPEYYEEMDDILKGIKLYPTIKGLFQKGDYRLVGNGYVVTIYIFDVSSGNSRENLTELAFGSEGYAVYDDSNGKSYLQSFGFDKKEKADKLKQEIKELIKAKGIKKQS